MTCHKSKALVLCHHVFEASRVALYSVILLNNAGLRWVLMMLQHPAHS